METLPESTVADELAAHANWCQLGERQCIDCRAARDPRTINALAIANVERRRLGDWISSHDWLCVYCGAFAETRDHLVPKPWTGPSTRRYVPVVPACSDCNTRIGAAFLFTIPERAQCVAEALRRKHRKELRIPDRDDEWFAEFGHRMRTSLRAAQVRRQEIRRRLMVLDAGGSDCVPEAYWAST